MKFSSSPNISVLRCLNPLFQSSLFRCLSLSRISHPKIRINKIVNSVDYHPSPSRLVSRTYSNFFLYTPQGFIPLHETCLIFFSNLYIPPCGKNLGISCVNIPRECIESRSFDSCSHFPVKTRPEVLIITPQAEGKY